METKIDISKLSNEQLLEWVNCTQPDKELREMVSLLRYATMDEPTKFFPILKDVIFKGHRLIAYYPMFDEPSSVDGMTFIGSIIDGGLYLD